jgi:hypothetical protein
MAAIIAVYAFSFVGATLLLPLLLTSVNCIQIAMLHQPIDSAERPRVEHSKERMKIMAKVAHHRANQNLTSTPLSNDPLDY